MHDHQPSSVSHDRVISHICTLSLQHPSVLQLITTYRPCAQPSRVSQKSFNAYINRLSSVLLSRDESTGERRAAWEVAMRIVEQDEEGTVVIGWGKGWIGVCLGMLSSIQTASSSLKGPLDLLATLVLVSPQYPSFERDAVHPITGKLAVQLTKLVERITVEVNLDYSLIDCLLETLSRIIPHTPAPFRPLAPSIRSHLLRLIHSSSTPHEIRLSAADVVARLHLTVGKAQAGTAWSTEMRDAVAGIGMSLSGVVADGWEEDAGVAPSLPSQIGAIPLPTDAAERLPIAMGLLEGWTEVILALLRYPTARPVAIPIAHLGSASRRCLNLTLHTPTVSYITPQHTAALLAGLPRIWSAGMMLLGGVAIACGDHLFPHLSNILDHTVYLQEHLPSSMTDVQIQLIRLHNLLLTLYPPELLPVEYLTRLLKLSLTRVGSLLDPKTETASTLVNGTGGKRGKKRQRGQEDVLVGDLEGRQSRAFSEANSEVILETLQLIPLLHTTPLLPPTLLTFSIRLHLSLHLDLPNTPYTNFANPSRHSAISQAVQEVLNKALTMTGNESGSSRGWKAILLGVLKPTAEFDGLLHPALPLMIRPTPPLSQLHYFAPESEEERKLRLEMGFTTSQDPTSRKAAEDNEAESVDGDVDMGDAAEAMPGIINPIMTRETPKMPEMGRLTSLHMGGEAKTAILVGRAKDVATPVQLNSNLTELSAEKDSADALPPSTVTVTEETTIIPAEEWMSSSKGKEKMKDESAEVVVELHEQDVVMLSRDEDDEEIPELDSGSSDFEGEDDEEDDGEEGVDDYASM